MIAKAEEDDGAKNFLIVEKQPKNWNYSGTAGSLWFYFEDDVTNFNNYIANTVDFKFFRYKAKLQGYTEATKTHWILSNAAISVSLKDLGSFWRSLEMPLTNCKAKSKLRWIKYFLLCVVANENEDANSKNYYLRLKISSKCD